MLKVFFLVVYCMLKLKFDLPILHLQRCYIAFCFTIVPIKSTIGKQLLLLHQLKQLFNIVPANSNLSHFFFNY
ncbi:hypothetical protein CW304_13735 [Bacillus sp. UFRGS-B20]|nr:hypothetical protein CW304_13735 [Bacillus sp. UFRGS-B20]